MKSDQIIMYSFNMIKYMYLGSMCAFFQIPVRNAAILVFGFLILDVIHQFYTAMYYSYRKGN